MSRFYNDYEGNDLLYMDNYLEHYGRKGMHWGQHLPDILQYLMGVGRYRGKTHGQANAIRRRRKTAKVNAQHKAQVQKKRTESLAKARATAAKNAPRRKELDKIVKNGSAADILKVANELTPKQRQQALDQLRFKSSLQDLNNKDIAASQAKITNVMNNVGKFAETSGKVIDTAIKGKNLVDALRGSKKEKTVGEQLSDELLSNAKDLSKDARKTGGKEAGDKALQEALLRAGALGIYNATNNKNNDKKKK